MSSDRVPSAFAQINSRGTFGRKSADKHAAHHKEAFKASVNRSSEVSLS